jgi:hypothetical protein
VTVTYRIGGRVPNRVLPRLGDGVLVPVRGRPREAVALLFPRLDPDWGRYLGGLGDVADELRHWDGRLVVVVPAPGREWVGLTRGVAPEVWLVVDPEGVLQPATSTGEPPRPLPAAVVADRYGEVYRVWGREDPAARPAPEPRELEAWLRYLALQCPE